MLERYHTRRAQYMECPIQYTIQYSIDSTVYEVRQQNRRRGKVYATWVIDCSERARENERLWERENVRTWERERTRENEREREIENEKEGENPIYIVWGTCVPTHIWFKQVFRIIQYTGMYLRIVYGAYIYIHIR